MICPKCNEDELIPITEEVDIGVGFQTHVLGWECSKCGEQFAACNDCGAITPNHEAWCKTWRSEP